MKDEIRDNFRQGGHNIKPVMKRIFILVLAVVSAGAVDMNFAGSTAENAGGTVYAVLDSLQGWGLAKLLCVVGLAYLYRYFAGNLPVRKDMALFSFLLSFFMLIGNCYRDAVGIALLFQSPAQMIKGMIILVGWGGMLYCAVYLLWNWMAGPGRKLGTANREEGKESRIREGVFIFICWLPWLIAFYPGTTTYDAGTMLEQFFGYAPLTNHHPYFQILFIGIFVKAGHILGSAAAGMFLYILLQVGAFIMTVVYVAGVLEKIGIHRRVIHFLLGLYAFVPVFPLYAISVGKNINFSIAVLLLTVFILEMTADAGNFFRSPVRKAFLFITLILICLFRNEGIVFVIGCFPCIVFLAGKQWKKVSGILIGVILFWGIWMKGILPAAGVENGSIAEALSVPFMQTARCVFYYGEEMSDEEKSAIDKILGFDTLAERYLPEFSDRVKGNYNEAAAPEDWKAYLQVYFRQLIEHPVTYADAVLNKCYGYFYPDDMGRTKSYYVYYADVPTLNEDGFDLKSRFPETVEAMGYLLEAFRKVPLFGYTTSIGAYFWCAFISVFFVIISKKKKLLLLFVPTLITLLVCAASPVNAYFRYGLPAVFCAPLFGAVSFYAVTHEEKMF